MDSSDEVAFRSLLERFQPGIFAFTLALTGDENAADSLAQKVFVRAYRALRPRDASMASATSLYRLAFEECVLQSRTEGLRRTLQRCWAIFVPHTASTAAATGELTGGRAALREGLQALSAKARILLLLTEVAQQSVSELAQITGSEEVVIRKELLKARRDLSMALRQIE